uniref:Gnk2-homologous domain-containing protein n=1 Tax=Leersia perrieri TaxID=77586 RepID=A0A0D9V6E9_9ORYZ
MAIAALERLLLTLVLLAAAVGRHAASGDGSFYGAKCTQASTWSPANNTKFRANVLALLGRLPSAAAPSGFASLRSGSAAFARGICFGDQPPTQSCLDCLSAVAKKLTDEDGCDASQRGAAWSDGCFVHFADTNATSPYEETSRYRIQVVQTGAAAASSKNSAAFDATLVALAERLAPRAANASRLLLATSTTEGVPLASGGGSGTTTVRAMAQCMRDRSPADCARCVQRSARELGKCCWDVTGGVTAYVLGYNGHLRLDMEVFQSRLIGLK